MQYYYTGDAFIQITDSAYFCSEIAAASLAKLLQQRPLPRDVGVAIMGVPRIDGGGARNDSS